MPLARRRAVVVPARVLELRAQTRSEAFLAHSRRTGGAPVLCRRADVGRGVQTNKQINKHQRANTTGGLDLHLPAACAQHGGGGIAGCAT